MKFGYNVDRDRFGQAAALDFLRGKRNDSDYAAERAAISAQRDLQMGQIAAGLVSDLGQQRAEKKKAASAAQEQSVLESAAAGEAIAAAETHGKQSDAYKKWKAEHDAKFVDAAQGKRGWLKKLFQGPVAEDYLDEYRDLARTSEQRIQSTPEQQASRSEYERVRDMLGGVVEPSQTLGPEGPRDLTSAEAEASALSADSAVMKHFRDVLAPEERLGFMQSQRQIPTTEDRRAAATAESEFGTELKVKEMDVLAVKRAEDFAKAYKPEQYGSKEDFASAAAVFTMTGKLTPPKTANEREMEKLQLMAIRKQLTASASRENPSTGPELKAIEASRKDIESAIDKLSDDIARDPTNTAASKRLLERQRQLADLDVRHAVVTGTFAVMTAEGQALVGEITKDGTVDFGGKEGPPVPLGHLIKARYPDLYAEPEPEPEPKESWWTKRNPNLGFLDARSGGSVRAKLPPEAGTVLSDQAAAILSRLGPQAWGDNPGRFGE